MTAKKPNPTPQENIQTDGEKPKVCFAIMPIADMDGYDAGHFTRVYEYIIKPACISAGFEPHRADLVSASNYIIIDILQKIVDSDMVICDLSGRNPNVLYELGVRQAFNLPTVLIKDSKTPKIFDIQGLRYTEYSHTLRIDEVQRESAAIHKSITETAQASGTVNSMIQLLGINAAPLPQKVQVSDDTSLILDSIRDISLRLTNIESPNSRPALAPSLAPRKSTAAKPSNIIYNINEEGIMIGEELYLSGKSIGNLASVTAMDITVIDKNSEIKTIKFTDPSFKGITSLPF